MGTSYFKGSAPPGRSPKVERAPHFLQVMALQRQNLGHGVGLRSKHFADVLDGTLEVGLVEAEAPGEALDEAPRRRAGGAS